MQYRIAMCLFHTQMEQIFYILLLPLCFHIPFSSSIGQVIRHAFMCHEELIFQKIINYIYIYIYKRVLVNVLSIFVTDSKLYPI